MLDLTLIIPAKKEAEALPKVLEELTKLDCKITVSLQKDDLETINAIKSFNVNIYEQVINGYGSSLIEAITKCETKYFCIFNADGSFEMEEIKKMYESIEKFDFIFGSRYLKDSSSDDDTFLTLVGNYFFTKLARILYGLELTDILYTFIMGNVSSFKKINLINSDFRFCVELPIKMHKLNMKYKTISSIEKKRIAGKKKVNEFKDGSLILLEILRNLFQR